MKRMFYNCSMFKVFPAFFMIFSTGRLVSEPLDLNACLRQAGEQSQALKSAELDLRLAAAGVKAARAPFLPFTNIQGSEILAGDAMSGALIGEPVQWNTDTYAGAWN